MQWCGSIDEFCNVGSARIKAVVRNSIYSSIFYLSIELSILLINAKSVKLNNLQIIKEVIFILYVRFPKIFFFPSYPEKTDFDKLFVSFFLI